VVGRWGLRDNVEQDQLQLHEAGADQVETTLLATRTHLHAWLPVLTQEATRMTEATAARGGRMVAV
jgi:hypothetical protein